MRQTDPDRGQSPWRRGVRQNSQVLICPGCQASHDWMSDLDRCSQCSSVHLVRRLGELECRDCGAVVPPAPDDPAGGADSGGALRGAGVPATQAGSSPELSAEVAQALERVLGRGLASQSAQLPHGAVAKTAGRPRAVTG